MAICTLAFVLIFTFIFIDKCYAEAIQQDKHKRIMAIINKKNEKIQIKTQVRETNLNQTEAEKREIGILSEAVTFNHSSDFHQGAASKQNFDGTSKDLREVMLSDNDIDEAPEEDYEVDEAQPIRWSMLKDLKYPLIWYNIYLFSITSVMETLWFSMITKCLVVKYDYKLEESNNLIASQSVVAMVLVVINSVWSQKFGRKNDLYIFAFVIMNIACLILIFQKEKNDIVVYLALLHYSMFQAIQDPIGWPAMALCTPKSAVALSFGLGQFFNNVFGSIFPLFFGYLLKDDDIQGYNNALWSIFGLSTFSFIIAVISKIEDLKMGGTLHYPENSKNVRMIKTYFLDKLRPRAEIIGKLGCWVSNCVEYVKNLKKDKKQA